MCVYVCGRGEGDMAKGDMGKVKINLLLTHDNMTHLTMAENKSVVVTEVFKIVCKELGGDL